MAGHASGGGGASGREGAAGGEDAFELFTAPWADAYRDAVNANEAYGKAAADWEGPIALHLVRDPAKGVESDRAVLLDLWHGECRGAKAVTADEAQAEADYVIRGDHATWMRILDGALNPLKALMFGRLKLTKGRLRDLLPYTRAAKELVESAQDVPVVR